MFRRSVLIVAALFTVPFAWRALVTGTMTWEAVGIRFLIALPLAAILVGLVRLAAHVPDAADDDEADPDDAPADSAGLTSPG